MVRQEIEHYVAGLEDRFGRVTAFHVVVKAPGQHHRTGGLYEIDIDLPHPMARKSISRAPRALTNAMATFILPCTMRSSAPGGGCRIGRGACRAR